MSIFDVPEFVLMPAVGIDISTNTVRFIEFKKKGGVNHVSKHGSMTIPPGIVQAGSVQDPVAMSKLISEMAREHKLTLANVALPEEQSFLVQMDIPLTESQDIRTFIELHLEDYVPITATECVFDYTVIPSIDKDITSVIACVFPNKIIEQYMEIFNGTGITPKTFELQSQAMARAIFPKDDVSTFMGIDIGKDITNIFIAKNNVVQFSAILDMGGDNISNEIARSLNISFEEADVLKTNNGLMNSAGESDIRNPMISVLDKMRAEIVKYFSYWQTKNSGAAKIDHVYLTGGGSNLLGIPEYFEQGLSSNVIVANPWINILDFNLYTPPIKLNASRGYAAAIGLALKDSQH